MLESSIHPTQSIGIPSQLRTSADTTRHDRLDYRYHSMPQQEQFLSHKDLYLRKGKWTAEEERYANKVIEYFNGGVLKLDDHERGITLRAYLAQKLGCDPMRITKKYTGASCLGKRVYHAYKQGGKNEEVDKATADLNLLEEEFRSRLQQMNKRRGGGSYHESSQVMVSTPGIDSMLQQSGFPSTWQGQQQQPGMMYGYPMPGYMPGIAPGRNAVEMHMKRQQHYQHHYHHPNGFQNGDHSSAEGSPCASPLQQDGHRGARSYSSDQTTAPDYSPTLSGRRYDLDTNHDHEWGLPVKTEAVSGSVNRTMLQHLAQTGPQRRKGSEGSTSSGGSSTAHRQIKLPQADNNSSRVVERHPPDPGNTTRDGLQRVKVSEHDTEAASSLLGFFTQLERNSSQEDMVHFFEGVQKNVAAATVAAGQSSSKSSNSSSAAGAISSSGSGGGVTTAHFVEFSPLPPASTSSK